MNRPHDISSIAPDVTERRSGWFAVSPPESPLRIGVEGTTEAEVRERFQQAAERWAALLALPDPPRVPSAS